MFSSHPFTPPKLSAYVDEAKAYAAEHTLQTLGIPTEGGDAATTAATAASATVFPGTGGGGREIICHLCQTLQAAECLGTPFVVGASTSIVLTCTLCRWERYRELNQISLNRLPSASVLSGCVTLNESTPQVWCRLFVGFFSPSKILRYYY